MNTQKLLKKFMPKGKAGKGGGSVGGGLKIAVSFFLGIMTLGILGFALIIVLGNLSGSSGFTAGTLNANRSDDILGNLTEGASSFFTNANAWFTLLSVVIIIAIVAVVIQVVRGLRGVGSGEDL